MDRKNNKSTSLIKRRGRRSAGPDRGLRVNSMIYKTTWTDSAVTSGTTGAITYTVSPSIVSSSEYSTMQAIFTEIKLISFRVVLVPVQSNSTSVTHSYIAMATNMLMNGTTFTQPTTYPSVENSTKVVRVNSTAVRNFSYLMPVPRNFEYQSIVGDAPTIPTPWAGSPGLVLIYGANFSSSIVYWQISVTAVYALRGRQ